MKLGSINNSPDRLKAEFIIDVRGAIQELGYEIVDEDLDRPWGAFFRFNEKHTEEFLGTFFKDFKLPAWIKKQKLYPKFLLVAPNKRLSWQYHNRRGEVWNIPLGPVRVYTSKTDKQPTSPTTLNQGDYSEAQVKIRHRLAGADNWGVVAENWVHSDKSNPSSEKDIVRLSDDFTRN